MDKWGDSAIYKEVDHGAGVSKGENKANDGNGNGNGNAKQANGRKRMNEHPSIPQWSGKNRH